MQSAFSIFRMQNTTQRDGLAEALINAIAACDHALDAAGFAALLEPGVEFQMGSNPPIAGRVAVEQFVSGLFSGLSSITHHVQEGWSTDKTILYRGLATFIRRDASSVTLPYMNRLEIGEQGVARYQIHIDPTPLFQAGSAA